MAEPLLRVFDASKRYPGGIEALRQANLTIEGGEFVCLIGASGCGKSTLLRMIAGFKTPTEGEVIMRGKPVTGPDRTAAWYFRTMACFPGSPCAAISRLVLRHAASRKPRWRGRQGGSSP